jgi:mono/diheme cytochrome c family protein
MKTLKLLFILGVISFGFLAFTQFEQDEWVVPAKYEKMTNPEEDSKENIAIGKSLYSKHCKSCHGKEGYGDGPKADEVEGDLGDFSSGDFQAQSDGAVFYKSYIGRKDMPSFEKKMSEEDAWLVVHYMRTLEE